MVDGGAQNPQIRVVLLAKLISWPGIEVMAFSENPIATVFLG